MFERSNVYQRTEPLHVCLPGWVEWHTLWSGWEQIHQSTAVLYLSCIYCNNTRIMTWKLRAAFIGRRAVIYCQYVIWHKKSWPVLIDCFLAIVFKTTDDNPFNITLFINMSITWNISFCYLSYLFSSHKRKFWYVYFLLRVTD